MEQAYSQHFLAGSSISIKANEFVYNNMKSSQLGELSSQQLKTRQLAEEYLKIQQNTQYLTNLLRFSPHRRRIDLKADQSPDLRSLATLTVQIAYFLFTCQVKQVNLYLSQRIYHLNPNRRDPLPEVCCEYILEKDFLKLSQEQQACMKKDFARHEFIGAHSRIYGQYALQYVNILTNIVLNQGDRYKNPADRVIVKQFTGLSDILKNHLEPKIQNLQHPRVVILALEESEIFRQYSVLVKVMNNSIFSAIRNSKNKQIFQEICKMQNIFSQIKLSKNQLEMQAQQIQTTFQSFFKILIKSQVITVEQSINDQSKNEQGKPVANSASNNKNYFLGETEGTTINDRKYTCKIQVSQKQLRVFNQSLFEALVAQALNNYTLEDVDKTAVTGIVGSKNQFLIQYMPFKGIISVKYVTPIDLTIQNTDIIMFQCNSIAFHWSNVSLQIVQKAPNKPMKRKQRYLALKTLSHLHLGERPLFKLLSMIDLVMLCAKIAEPQLKKSFIRNEDYKIIEQISEKVDHMTKLFIKKIERYYKVISQNLVKKEGIQ